MVPTQNDGDLALLERWRAGDGAAGNALFKRHFESLYRFFEHKVDAEVDELVQETFLACLHGRDRFAARSSFRTYLFAIARHTLYGHWRARRHDAVLEFDEISVASLSTSARGKLARREELERLLDALRELPLEQQLLIELHYWEGLERSHLAEVFGVEEATTRSRLFRAREALLERLEAASARSPATVGDGFDAWVRSLRATFGEPPKLRNADRGDDTNRA
jgi:RNA polymerase sigma-70 factor (ECF subfamily)